MPLSFALTGPVSGVLGPETTIVVAGLLGAVLMGAMLFYPGVRDPERQVAPAEPATPDPSQAPA